MPGDLRARIAHAGFYEITLLLANTRIRSNEISASAKLRGSGTVAAAFANLPRMMAVQILTTLRGPIVTCTAEQQPAAEEPVEPSRGLLYLALAISIVVSALCLLIYLLRQGERGNTIAGPASLFVAIVALVCTLVIWLFDKGRIRLEISERFWKVLKKLSILALLATLIIDILIFREVLRTPDVPITEAVQTTGSAGMVDGYEALIRIPGPSRRSHLALVPVLRNNEPSGNCVGSATLDSRLLIDGVNRQRVKGVRPSSEIRFPLGESAQTAAVGITVRMRDPACRVDLLIHEAVLFSDAR